MELMLREGANIPPLPPPTMMDLNRISRKRRRAPSLIYEDDGDRLITETWFEDRKWGIPNAHRGPLDKPNPGGWYTSSPYRGKT